MHGQQVAVRGIATYHGKSTHPESSYIVTIFSTKTF